MTCSDILKALDYTNLDQSSPAVMRFVSALVRSGEDEVSLESLKSLLEVKTVPGKDDRVSAYLALDANLDGSVCMRDMISLADRLGLSVDIDAKLKYVRRRWRMVSI